MTFFTGRRTSHRPSDRLGGQGVASPLEGASDRVVELDRRHDVPEGPEVLPHERQELLDRLSHRSGRNFGLVRIPTF